jgi:hypothetical protein
MQTFIQGVLLIVSPGGHFVGAERCVRTVSVPELPHRRQLADHRTPICAGAVFLGYLLLRQKIFLKFLRRDKIGWSSCYLPSSAFCLLNTVSMSAFLYPTPPWRRFCSIQHRP